MSRGLVIAIGVLAAVAAGAWIANASANAGGAVDNTSPEDTSADSGASWTDELSGLSAIVNPFAMYEKASAQSDASDANVSAFLAALRYAEGTDRAANPWAVVYGYAFTITDFSKHPAELGWAGGAITHGVYAGKVSTAAGAYQENFPTWKRARAALGLTDFSPPSQDAAAVWLIDKAGALDAVKAGDMATACALCAPTWASLPGSTAGQGGKSLDAVEAAFTDAGGVLA